MNEGSDIEIVTYRKNYKTFVVTVDRETKGEQSLTGDQIDGLIRSGHSGIIAKRNGIVIGFAFYKIQRRTIDQRVRKTLWITRMGVIPLGFNDEVIISAEMMKKLKMKAVENKISVSALLTVGSCHEMGAEAAEFIKGDPLSRGGITAVRVESGRGVILEATKNRLLKYFQEKR